MINQRALFTAFSFNDSLSSSLLRVAGRRASDIFTTEKVALFVAVSPTAGYSNGFAVFTILTVIALGLLYVLYRYPPAEGTAR